VFKDSIRTAQ